MLQSLRQFKAEIFQALGHPTRVAIVEQLRLREMSVGQLCEKVGIEQANASQHLGVLRSKHIVETRKEGNQIFYKLRNPLVGDILEMMRKYFFDHMNEAMEMLKQEKREATKAMHKEEKQRRPIRR
ncbi:MAG TPA: metalloregulator ArsR/SmtB family transcription factor [Lacipirellulaceae bacterium]|jgi:ArsR family transcriptional regulator|nr:metalloregulator ArsR/SmtB family transcription factor [Lacipirellulaceae bacterium]